jgi:hypothetical protein
MNIRQQAGIVSTIIFSPFNEAGGYESLRSSLFEQASSASKCSPISRVDDFDESILVFDNYSEALEYLVHVFRFAAIVKNHSLGKISLRSSLCHGNYCIHQDQIYGEAVNLATRLSFSSRENELQICGVKSQIIRDFLQEHDDIDLFIRKKEGDCLSLGLKDEDLTQPKYTQRAIQINYGGLTTNYQISRHQEIKIGRSDASDLYIDGDHVSRDHATIIIKNNEVFIKDHSVNGTYVYLENHEIYLTQDSVKLSNRGHVCCGLSKNAIKDNRGIISYSRLKDSRSAAA